MPPWCCWGISLLFWLNFGSFSGRHDNFFNLKHFKIVAIKKNITQYLFFFLFFFRFMSIWGRNYVHCMKTIVFLTSLSAVGMAMILPLWPAPTTISSECSTGNPDRKSPMKLPKKLPNLRLSLSLEKWVFLGFFNAAVLLHFTYMQTATMR